MTSSPAPPGRAARWALAAGWCLLALGAAGFLMLMRALGSSTMVSQPRYDLLASALLLVAACPFAVLSAWLGPRRPWAALPPLLATAVLAGAEAWPLTLLSLPGLALSVLVLVASALAAPRPQVFWVLVVLLCLPGPLVQAWKGGRPLLAGPQARESLEFLDRSVIPLGEEILGQDLRADGSHDVSLYGGRATVTLKAPDYRTYEVLWQAPGQAFRDPAEALALAGVSREDLEPGREAPSPTAEQPGQVRTWTWSGRVDAREVQVRGITQGQGRYEGPQVWIKGRRP